MCLLHGITPDRKVGASHLTWSLLHGRETGTCVAIPLRRHQGEHPADRLPLAEPSATAAVLP